MSGRFGLRVRGSFSLNSSAVRFRDLDEVEICRSRAPSSQEPNRRSARVRAPKTFVLPRPLARRLSPPETRHRPLDVPRRQLSLWCFAIAGGRREDLRHGHRATTRDDSRRETPGSSSSAPRRSEPIGTIDCMTSARRQCASLPRRARRSPAGRRLRSIRWAGLHAQSARESFSHVRTSSYQRDRARGAQAAARTIVQMDIFPVCDALGFYARNAETFLRHQEGRAPRARSRWPRISTSCASPWAWWR